MKPIPSVRTRISRLGFTLVELLVVIGIIALLISILLPALSKARETANRVKCAANLKAFGTCLLVYANDNNGAYPRTNGDVTTAPTIDTLGYNDSDWTTSSTIPACSVMASMYLLARQEQISLQMFICPSSSGIRLVYAGGGVQNHSNFNIVPGAAAQGNTAYSIQCQFPDANGANDGFRWGTSLNSDFALMADLNPGVYATGGPEKVNTTSSTNTVQAGNSPNHNKEGQNVLFGDYHAEFYKTPFCGVDRDNIYGPGVVNAGAGNFQPPDATTPLLRGPMNHNDSVLLPYLNTGG